MYVETTLNTRSFFWANFVGGGEKKSKISEYQSDNLLFFCEKMLSKQIKSLHSLSLEIHRTDIFIYLKCSCNHKILL